MNLGGGVRSSFQEDLCSCRPRASWDYRRRVWVGVGPCQGHVLAVALCKISLIHFCEHCCTHCCTQILPEEPGDASWGCSQLCFSCISQTHLCYPGVQEKRGEHRGAALVTRAGSLDTRPQVLSLPILCICLVSFCCVRERWLWVQEFLCGLITEPVDFHPSLWQYSANALCHLLSALLIWAERNKQNTFFFPHAVIWNPAMPARQSILHLSGLPKRGAEDQQLLAQGRSTVSQDSSCGSKLAVCLVVSSNVT